MANKLRGTSIYGRITPFIRHFHVVLDVPVHKLNLPIRSYCRRYKILLGFLDWQSLRQRKQTNNHSNSKVFHRCKTSNVFGYEFAKAPMNLCPSDNSGTVFIRSQELSTSMQLAVIGSLSRVHKAISRMHSC